ncbi:MAG: hypothetical protein U0871_20850 [Gemmataceae bacterium]
MRVLTLDARSAADKATVRRLQFAPDGRRFAAVLGPVSHTVAVCDAASGEVTWEVPGGGDATGEPAISPDLDAIAWMEDEPEEQCDRVLLWVAGSDAGLEIGGNLRMADVSAAAFHPDGRWLAVGVYDQKLRSRAISLWHRNGTDHRDPAATEVLQFDSNQAVSALAWSADADRLAVAGEFGGLWVIAGLAAKMPQFGVPYGELRFRQAVRTAIPASQLRQPVRTLCFALDGRRLLALDGRSLDIWDFDRGEWLGPLPAKPRVLDAAYSLDGRTLAVTRRDGTVTFLDAGTLAPRTAYDWKLGPLYSVAFSPDGLTCAAGGTRRRVVVWDLE